MKIICVTKTLCIEQKRKPAIPAKMAFPNTAMLGVKGNMIRKTAIFSVISNVMMDMKKFPGEPKATVLWTGTDIAS